MKRVNGVVFENGQTVSLEATKNELVIDDHIRIPHGELESFIRTVRRLSRDAERACTTRAQAQGIAHPW